MCYTRKEFWSEFQLNEALQYLGRYLIYLTAGYQIPDIKDTSFLPNLPSLFQLYISVGVSHGSCILPSAVILKFQLLRNLSFPFHLPKTENEDLFLLIIRIICKGDYYSWFEFYFNIKLLYAGVFFVMYLKLSIWEHNSVFISLLVDGHESLN